MTTYALDLDWAADNAVIVATSKGVTSRVIDHYGPAGGWPIVRFEGEWDALSEVLRDYDADLDPHEFVRPVCGACGEATGYHAPLAEVVLLADPTSESRIVHEPCFDRETMVLA